MLGSFIEPCTSLKGISTVLERSSAVMHLCGCRRETKSTRRHFEHWPLRLDPRPSCFRNHLPVWLLLKAFKCHVFQDSTAQPPPKTLLLNTAQPRLKYWLLSALLLRSCGRQGLFVRCLLPSSTLHRDNVSHNSHDDHIYRSPEAKSPQSAHVILFSVWL